jgi:hypothetical protein
MVVPVSLHPDLQTVRDVERRGDCGPVDEKKETRPTNPEQILDQRAASQFGKIG